MTGTVTRTIATIACVASPFCLPLEHDHPANSSLEFQPKERGASVTPIQTG